MFEPGWLVKMIHQKLKLNKQAYNYAPVLVVLCVFDSLAFKSYSLPYSFRCLILLSFQLSFSGLFSIISVRYVKRY